MTPPTDDIIDSTDLVRNGIWFGGAQLVGWLTTPLVLLMIARNLGASALGSFGLALAVWAVVGVVVDLGLEAEVVRRAALANNEVHALLRGAAYPIGRAWLVATPIVVGGQFLVFQDATLTALFAVVGLQTLVDRIAGLLSGAARGLELMSDVSLADGVAKLVTLAATIALVLVTSEVWIVASAATVAAVVRVIMLVRVLGNASVEDASDPKAATPGLARSARSLLGLNLVVIAYMQVDIIMMSVLVDAPAMGWYTAAERFYTTSLFAANVVVGVALPSMAKIASDPVRALDLTRRALRVLTVAAAALGLGLWAVSDRAAPLLFGPEFDDASSVLALFALAIPATYALVLLGGVAVASGRERIWVRIQLAGLLATIVANLVLIPLADRRYGNGALGGAWTTLAIELAMLPVAVRLIQPDLFDRATVLQVARAVASAGAMAVLVLMASALPLALLVLLGAVAYGAALTALGGLPLDDLRQLRGVQT